MLSELFLTAPDRMSSWYWAEEGGMKSEDTYIHYVQKK
jgi:hypothetical protein